MIRQVYKKGVTVVRLSSAICRAVKLRLTYDPDEGEAQNVKRKAIVGQRKKSAMVVRDLVEPASPSLGGILLILARHGMLQTLLL